MILTFLSGISGNHLFCFFLKNSDFFCLELMKAFFYCLLPKQQYLNFFTYLFSKINKKSQISHISLVLNITKQLSFVSFSFLNHNLLFVFTFSCKNQSFFLSYENCVFFCISPDYDFSYFLRFFLF